VKSNYTSLFRLDVRCTRVTRDGAGRLCFVLPPTKLLAPTERGGAGEAMPAGLCKGSCSWHRSPEYCRSARAREAMGPFAPTQYPGHCDQTCRSAAPALLSTLARSRPALALRTRLFDAASRWVRTLGGPPTASATAPPLPLVLQSLPRRWPLLEPLALARLHELARACRVVQYSVLFGDEDSLPSAKGEGADGSDTGLCRFLLVDHAVDPARAAPLTPVMVAPLPFPSSRQRSAHAFKAVPWLLFPAAETVVYLDAKVRLTTTLRDLLERFNWVLHPLIVLRHPSYGDERVIVNGVASGITGEHAVLAARKRENWTQDLLDVDTLRGLYCWDRGPKLCARWGGVIESSVLIWRRPSGRFDNGAMRAALRLLQGLWLAEIATLSHREQLSFTFVMDTLKLRDAVFGIARCNYTGEADPAQLLVEWVPHRFEAVQRCIHNKWLDQAWATQELGSARAGLARTFCEDSIERNYSTGYW